MKEKLLSLAEIFEPRKTGEWGTDGDAENGFPVLRTTNFRNDGTISYDDIAYRTFDKKKKLENKFLKKGDILIEKSGGSETQPVGRVVYFDKDEGNYLNNNFTSNLRNERTDVIASRYLFYCLRWIYSSGRVKKFQNKTTGLLNLQLESYLNSQYFKIIPLNIQEARVARLDMIEKLVGKFREQIALLDVMVKSRKVSPLFRFGGDNQ